VSGYNGFVPALFSLFLAPIFVPATPLMSFASLMPFAPVMSFTPVTVFNGHKASAKAYKHHD
jgi:hypothetical protein